MDFVDDSIYKFLGELPLIGSPDLRLITNSTVKFTW